MEQALDLAGRGLWTARPNPMVGCVLVREDIGARATWFAQHPGNNGYRARAAMVSSRNFAHFTALHGKNGCL